MGTRADQALVDQGLVASRSLAKRLIEAGAVFSSIEGAVRAIVKASEMVDDSDILILKESVETQFASRAGAKLEGAITRCNIDIVNRFCMDLGQSTGGFTDCLLKRDAAHVLGVDVGHGQLAATIASDTRVTALEGVNVRHFDPRTNPKSSRYVNEISVIVLDLSFISLHLVLPTVTSWFAGAERKIDLLSLVKPQFEVGKGNVNKQGIVTDPQLLISVEQRIKQLIRDCGWECHDYFASPLLGGDGNKEFFVYATNGQ